jgi:peptidoglycan/LPS O-acetylase OafA/YrhL
MPTSHGPGGPDPTGRPYWPELDGLRAVAAGVVLFHHFDLFPFEHGGFLGVDLFLGLSGFLITGILLAELERSGSVRLGAFYRRRAFRLLPALFLLLVTALLAGFLFPSVDPDGLIPQSAAAAALYISNWVVAFEWFSIYPLQHTWSLAIEEQFYLFWPLVLIGVSRLGRQIGRPSGTLLVLLALFLLSWAWRASMHDASSARVYNGLDTRGTTLVAGAVLAAVLANPRVRSALELRKGTVLVAGIAAAAYLLAAFVLLTWSLGYGTRWAFVTDAAVVSVVGTCVLLTGHPLLRPLRVPPVLWAGRRSYGIYLWHWFILTSVGRGVLPLDGHPQLFAQIALTLLAAEVSYRFVERPLLDAERRWFPRRDLVRDAPT